MYAHGEVVSMSKISRLAAKLVLSALCLVAAGCAASDTPSIASNVAVEVLEERAGYSRVFLHKTTETGVRDILVQVTWEPSVPRELGVLLIGGYRVDSYPLENDPVKSWTLESSGYTVVRVGFPRMNMGSDVNFKDIASHPQDVATVLDYLRSKSDTFGDVENSRLAWLGVSMGGITGLIIESAQDPVVDLSGVVSIAGFLPLRKDGFDVPEYDFKGMAPTLLTASQTDETIPYSLTVGTFNELQSKGSNVVLLSRQLGLHGAVADCEALNIRLKTFVLEVLSGREVATGGVGGSCMAEGVLEGGTTGFGAATPLIGAVAP